MKPWESLGRAVAIDSTVLESRGGVWHQKHREKGKSPILRLIRRPIGPSRVGMGGSMAGNCMSSPLWRRFGFPSQQCSHLPMSPIVSLLLRCCAKCLPKSVSSWVTVITIRLICMRSVSAMTVCWWRPSMGATLIPMQDPSWTRLWARKSTDLKHVWWPQHAQQQSLSYVFSSFVESGSVHVLPG
jgi:hypothetical protein